MHMFQDHIKKRNWLWLSHIRSKISKEFTGSVNDACYLADYLSILHTISAPKALEGTALLELPFYLFIHRENGKEFPNLLVNNFIEKTIFHLYANTEHILASHDHANSQVQFTSPYRHPTRTFDIDDRCYCKSFWKNKLKGFQMRSVKDT